MKNAIEIKLDKEMMSEAIIKAMGKPLLFCTYGGKNAPCKYRSGTELTCSFRQVILEDGKCQKYESVEK